MLADGLQAGVKFCDHKLSRERKRVMQYYNGELPAPVHGGNSKYVSTDVFDTVESMKATLLETFSAHSDIVAFAPKGEEDLEEAEVSTAYTKHVIFEQNPGLHIFGSVMHDGLTARTAIAKVYWDTVIEPIQEEFEGLDEAALAVLLDDDAVEVEDIDLDDETKTWSGTITRDEDRSQVRIEPLPPEEVIVNPNIKSLTEAPQISHRMERTKSELHKEGYPKDKVKLLSHSDTMLEMDAERLARFDAVADGFSRSSETREEANKPYVIYETYAQLDLDGEGVSRMWRIVHCGAVVLEREQVDRHPFIAFSPLPIPHSFYGSNFAAKVIPTQNSRTVLIRSILDHAVLANNPRWGVVKGALTNPRELIDNRIGGLVNVSRQDGIFPLPQAPLNPFVFQTIELLDSAKEDVTGVSRLSQGLNKDAISNQNSQGMVEQLIGASMQRQKTIARAFAHQFLAPLYLEVYRLVVENENHERIIEIAGNYKPVDPKAWARMRDVSIDFRLGYGEKERLANEYLQFGQVLAQDQAIAHLYGPEERRNLYKHVAEAKGHKNISEFLKDAKTPPPGPDPKLMAEVELLKQEVQLNAREADRKDAEVKATIDLQKFQADMDKRFSTLEFMLKTRDLDRKDLETENRIEVAATEMELAKQTANDPDAEIKASSIISPNG